MPFADLFILGLLAHLIADWFLQNDWMARNKADLGHIAAWVHSGIHFALMLPIFGWAISGLIFVTHILIDTRKPLIWWRRVFGQTVYKPIPEEAGVYPVHEREFCHNSAAFAVAFWQDQVAHIVVVALAAWARTHGF